MNPHPTKNFNSFLNGYRILNIVISGSRVFGFCSSTPLPSFTLAIAVGAWESKEITYSPRANP